MSELPQTETLGFVPGGQPLAPLARGAMLGRYVVLDAVGQGGMGVVYAGYDPELDRKVALKLLRPDRVGSGSEAGRLRLLREAQAIARLSHPNVVAVYDAGTLGEQVFVAMEFVDGRTLRQWLTDAPEDRSWREIVDVFVHAGRGLAAAHAAGLVHRDFKPDNVLLGGDGRVRVVDFGLARPVGTSAETETRSEDAASSPSRLQSPITEWGVVLGTPAYMAPEQLCGEAADARTDQYSFCVALYEALFGRLPFDPESPERKPAEPPASSRVPPRVRQAILRGLSAEPADRYPSMDALLRELASDREAARRRWLSVGAAAAVAALVLVAADRAWQRSERLCGGSEARLAGVWDPARKGAVHAAFRATRLPFAEPAWSATTRALDGYARGWVRQRRDACEATRVREEQSEALLDRRMFCLDQRLRDLGALSDVLARADRQVVEKAVQATARLPPLAACADSAALTARVPPPADPGQRAAVEALGREMARARALEAAGKIPQALSTARQVAVRAAVSPYRPVRAEAFYLQGDLEERAGDPKASEKTLRRAVLDAEAAADDRIRAGAAIALVRVVGSDQKRFEPSRDWSELARAILDRTGGDDDLRAEYLIEVGRVATAESRFGDALRAQQAALQIRRRQPAPPAEIATSLVEVGRPLHDLGRYDEALAAYREALRLQTATLGPDHPEVATTIYHIGRVFYRQGSYEESIRQHRRALAIREAMLGPRHPLVAESLNQIGNGLDMLDDQAGALAAYQRALGIQRAVFGEPHPEVARTLDNIGGVYANHGRNEEALRYFHQSLDMRLLTLGRDHKSTADTLHNLGNSYTHLGRDREALVYFRQALEIEEKLLGPDHPDVAEELTIVGDLERRLGQPAQARDRLERALRIVEAQKLEPGTVARTRFALAQDLWDTGTDRPRAVRLAREAKADFESLDEHDEVALKEVLDWLKKNDRGAGP
jgi:tetratricopeptide (TPR) repeat protein/predicted Ser/Thr protein kinase